MLKRNLAFIVLSSLLALALILALVPLAHSLPPSHSDSAASAAVSPAASFDKLPNGAVYGYSNANVNNASTAVTVSSGATWGTQTNPYVINTINQWQLFINVINANNATYNAAGKYFYLNADLNFGGQAISPAGATTNGFKGIFYGGRHTISNVTFTNVNVSGRYQTGCFGLLNSASIFDLGFASNCKLTTSTYALTAGMLAARSSNSTIVNVTSRASHSMATSVANTSGTSQGNVCLGGLVGIGDGSSNTFYKCFVISTLTLTDTNAKNSATCVIDSNDIMGGLLAAGSTVNAYGCYVQTTMTFNSGGPMSGGISNTAVVASNCVIICNVTVTGNLNSPDCMAVGNYSAGKNLTNCYIVSNMPLCYGGIAVNATCSGCYATYSTGGSGGASCTAITSIAGITQTAYSNANNSTVISQAKSNSTVAGLYTLANTSSATGVSSVIDKTEPGGGAGTSYNIFLAKGLGSTGGSGNTTFAYSASAQNKTLTAPARTGYTFKGWSLVSPSGTVSGTTSYLTIPAGRHSDVIAYAVWELNAFTGTPSGATVTFGNDATLSASAVAHPATTSNSSYGVNLSFQWKNASGTNISGATSSTYKLTKPNFTTGTNYQTCDFKTSLIG